MLELHYKGGITMYYYNVIISDDYPLAANDLVFTFYSLKEALEYARTILEISDYCVSILKLEDNEDEQ